MTTQVRSQISRLRKTTPSRGATVAKTAAVATAAFEQVKQHLKARLAKGDWSPGGRMPSEAELVAQFGVSRMTVNRALRELQQEGLIDRTQGVGTFAAQLHRVSSSLTIRDIHEEIVARGHQHEATLHLRRSEIASQPVAVRLGVKTGSMVFHTLIVHHENGVPLQCEDRYVNPKCAPDYLDVDFTTVTPTHYLLEVAPLWEAQFSVEAGLPSAREAKLLQLKRGDPCLIVNRRTVNRGVPITYARLVHPASRYQIESAYKP
jgi:GntR family transcriptional regulator, histidine utilization repressor